MADKSGRLSLTQRAVMWAAQKAFGGSTTYSLTDHDAVTRLLGHRNDAGVLVTEQTAMQVSAVWSCVRVLSETVAALPWAFYERDRGGNLTKIDHALSEVLMGTPNSNMTPQELRESQMLRLGLCGNAYAHIRRRNDGSVISVEPDREITPVLVDGQLRYKRKNEFLDNSNVWHLKGFGDGLVGLSPVGMARQAFGLAMATETFGARFFKEGASAAGIVKMKDWLSDSQRETARTLLADMWSGLQNSHKVQLLEGGMDYQSITMPLEDAQFLQTRKFQVTEVCRWYRVPPHLVADLERATFSNIEQQALEFVQYTLMPYFVRYEQTTQKLLPLKDQGRVVLRFNVDGLLRADSAGRSALYSVLLQNGVLNRNEVRGLENRPRSEAQGMDDFTTQVNMTPIQQLGSTQNENPARTDRV